jgi:hypothetical protein
MNKYELYYKEYMPNSINAKSKIVKGKYLYIDKVNNVLLIDNVIIENLENLSQIRFLIKGYYQTINI